MSSVLFAGSALAGEIGVTNSYGHSFRNGTGVTNIQFNTNSQLTENSIYGAVKKETSSYGNIETTTTTSPGNSGNTPGGENSGNTTTTPGEFSDIASSFSFGFGERNYTETTNVTGTTQETYSFGSTNFTHSVGVFSR
jgi:hypothetical protein